jgi:flagellar biosynthesis/type III secretory pathway protein FliH
MEPIPLNSSMTLDEIERWAHTEGQSDTLHLIALLRGKAHEEIEDEKNEEMRNRARDEGYREGYEEGHGDGYDEGFEAGEAFAEARDGLS